MSRRPKAVLPGRNHSVRIAEHRSIPRHLEKTRKSISFVSARFGNAAKSYQIYSCGLIQRNLGSSISLRYRVSKHNQLSVQQALLARNPEHMLIELLSWFKNLCWLTLAQRDCTSRSHRTALAARWKNSVRPNHPPVPSISTLRHARGNRRHVLISSSRCPLSSSLQLQCPWALSSGIGRSERVRWDRPLQEGPDSWLFFRPIRASIQSPARAQRLTGTMNSIHSSEFGKKCPRIA